MLEFKGCQRLRMAYELRRRSRKDYKELGDVKLPRLPRAKPKDDDLYPIEVVERSGQRVKVHYIGYSEDTDEWKEAGDIIDLPPTQREGPYQPFEHHRELAYQIKLALNSGHGRDPSVRLEVPFDKLLFEGGLAQCGKLVARSRGHEVFAIDSLSRLEPLLGSNWHIRGLNDRLDFCYVNVDTVRYHLHQRQSVQSFSPEGVETTHGGYVLIFKFVRMDGVKQQWDKITSSV